MGAFRLQIPSAGACLGTSVDGGARRRGQDRTFWKHSSPVETPDSHRAAARPREVSVCSDTRQILRTSATSRQALCRKGRRLRRESCSPPRLRAGLSTAPIAGSRAPSHRAVCFPRRRGSHPAAPEHQLVRHQSFLPPVLTEHFFRTRRAQMGADGSSTARRKCVF